MKNIYIVRIVYDYKQSFLINLTYLNVGTLKYYNSTFLVNVNITLINT